MSLCVMREFQGEFEPVGSFDAVDTGDIIFSYSERYLSQKSAAPLSASLPLRCEPFHSNEYGGFFSGMIPEGPVRAELSTRFQIPQSDYLSMLARLGEECVGALMFRSDDAVESRAGFRPLTQADADELHKSEIVEIANAMQISRLSLAGAQSKTGWYLPRSADAKTAGPGQWMLPIGSAPSTHIIKVASGKHPDLPTNEQVCMDVAQASGLCVAGSFASEVLDNVFISERYDRVWTDGGSIVEGNRTPMRLHQEDFCQALGWPSFMKYENQPNTNYMAMCGRLLREQSSNAIADVQIFGRQVAIDYLLGNCDSHLKNHSLLLGPNWRSKRLSPAYDIVCTTILGYDHNLGIDIGDHRVIDEVDAKDFEFVAEDLSLPLRRYRAICCEVAECTKQKLGELSEASGDLGRVAAQIFGDAAPRIKVLEQFAS